MVNTKFEAYKIKRELKRIGLAFVFKRQEKNAFNEFTDNMKRIGSLVGLYHEQNNSVSITTNDNAKIRTKKTPMILCLYDDVSALELKIGDVTEVNGKTLKVTGIVNVQEWNVVSDISLEVVDNGIRA